MYVTEILTAVDRLIAGDGRLLAHVNCDRGQIFTTPDFEQSSSLKDLGDFFLKTIRDYQLSSKEIGRIRRAFTVVEKGKNIDELIEISKNVLTSLGRSPEVDINYQNILKEKKLAEEVFAELGVELQDTVEEEAIASTLLEAIFPEGKRFIKERLMEEAGVTEDGLRDNIRKMSKKGIEKVTTYIKALTEPKDLDHPATCTTYRRLKMRLLGGVRFAHTVTETKFHTAETPLSVSKSDRVAVPIKTRLNVRQGFGVFRVVKATIENLKIGTRALNALSLSKALVDFVGELLEGPTTPTECINSNIQKINKLIWAQEYDPAHHRDLTHFVIHETRALLEQTRCFLSNIGDKKPCLKEKLLELYNKNVQIFLDNTAILEKQTPEQVLKTLAFCPEIEKTNHISSLDQDITNSVFEVVQLSKEKPLRPDKARDLMHQKTLERFYSRKVLPAGVKREIIELTLEEVFQRNPETIHVIELLISL